MNQSPRRLPWLRCVLLSGAIATTASLSLFGPIWCRSVWAALQDSPKKVVDEVWQIVNREYVDATFNQVDWLATRQRLLSQNYTSPEQAYAAVRAALEQLGDPYTRFLDPAQYEALNNQTAGEVSGVGIRLEVNQQTQLLTVVEPIANSPALQAGIKPGDRIVSIDDEPTVGMSLEQASERIRGQIGTQVKLKIIRAGGPEFEITLTRSRIELPAVHYSLKQEGSTRVGYIRLQEFSSHAAEQMKRAIEDLKGQQVNAFVLDLRGNPGGLLRASIEIARMWMPTGAIVKTVDRNGKSEQIAANQTALTDLPLAVLVDGDSASSSEILTGALLDNDRATVIGSKTFGKALVQSLYSLSDGSGLAVTIAHYYTPNGTDINHTGIMPEIEISLNEEQKRQLADVTVRGTTSDPCYSSAITVLQAQISPRPVAVH